MKKSNRKPEQANPQLLGEASLPPPAVDPATGRIACDLPCAWCQYNLRTLRADGCCPECGKEVMDSVREWDPTIVHSHWMTMLKNGFDFLLWGILLVSPAALATCAFTTSRIFESALLLAASLGSGLFGLLMILIGAFLVIGSTPPLWTSRRLHRARSVFFAGILGTVMLFVCMVMLSPLRLASQSLAMLCVACAGSVPIAFGSYCRQLARCYPMEALREYATVVVWATVLCVTAAAAGSLALIVDQNWGIRAARLLASGFFIAAVIVFVGELPLWVILFFKLRRMIMDQLRRVS